MLRNDADGATGQDGLCVPGATTGAGVDLDGSELAVRLYDELRAVARRRMAGERAGHTLEPTALVHEVLLRFEAQDIHWQSEDQFIAYAAQTMRTMLVDHARRRATAKRGDGWSRVTLSGLEDEQAGDPVVVLELEDALCKLEQLSQRRALLVVLRFYGGMTVEQASGVLGVSRRTAQAEWTQARSWLTTELRR